MAKAKKQETTVTPANTDSIRNPEGKFAIPVRKTGEEVVIDFDNLPEQSRDYLIAYGLRQRLNDCHSDVTEKTYPDEKLRAQAVRDNIAAVVEALESGKVTLRREGSGLGKVGKKTLARALAILLAEVNGQSEAMNLGIIEAKGFDNVSIAAKTKYDIQPDDIAKKAGELASEAREAKAGDLAELI